MTFLWWLWCSLCCLLVIVIAFIGGMYWGIREYVRFTSQTRNRATWYRVGLLPDRREFWEMIKWLGRPFEKKNNKGKGRTIT